MSQFKQPYLITGYLSEVKDFKESLVVVKMEKSPGLQCEAFYCTQEQWQTLISPYATNGETFTVEVAKHKEAGWLFLINKL